MANKDFKVKNGIDIQSPLPVTMGGTGQTSTTNTLNSLLPSQTGNTNKVLQTDGTNTTWYTIPAAYTRGGMAGRPISPTSGDLYFNTDKKAFEVYNGTSWISLIANGAVPLAPTIGTATVSGLTASVPFTGPTDFGDAAITSYTATSNPGGITGSNASSPISVSGLSQATSYTFTVTATNSYGTSNASSASNSITTATTPGTPTSVTASDPGTDGYALVSWTAPGSNGGSAITDYVVQYSSNSGSTWTTFNDGTSSSTSATVTGLTLNTAYIFRVAAVNAIGTGSYSTASASFTPVAHDLGVMFPLQVITVGPSGSNGFVFNNIPQTYKHLQLRFIARGAGTGGASGGLKGTFINLNNDFSTTTPNHALYGNGTSAVSGYQTDARINVVPQTVPCSSATANVFGAAIMDFLDYSNTNKFKTVRALIGADVNGDGQVGLASACWNSTNAITSISIGTNEAYVQHTQIALYGIKSA